MPQPQRAVVLSDLHLGPDNGLCSFLDDEPLAALLGRIAEEEEPLELVLAGDIFDFLQGTGYDGYRPEKAEERFEEILRAPRTARVVSGIAACAKKASVEITLLAGNHDPELLLPAVRRRFERAIQRLGSVRYPEDEPLVPARGEPDERWAVHGRRLGDPDDPHRAVWVVHGDRWDSSNAVDREAFLGVARPERDPVLPSGSHLVYEVLQPLKGDHPWIDTLKPEVAVLLLLLYLAPEAAGNFLSKHLGLSRNLLRGAIEARLGRGPLLRVPAAPAEKEPISVGEELAELLAEDLEEEGGDPDLRLADLDALLRGDGGVRAGTLAAHGGAARWAVRAALKRLRKKSEALFGTEGDGILENAWRVAPEGLSGIVAGHTHDPRAVAEGFPRYVNTGTWLPIARVPSGDVKELIDDLDEKRPWPSSTPRTFARVAWGEGVPTLSLRAADERGIERVLADV